FLKDMGLTGEVFSGGQPETGPDRVGSHRHDDGMAGDMFFYKDGRKLDWANPEDQPIFKDIVKRGREAGITGMGAGEGYMQPGSMHIGYGKPAVWGAGGQGANAPDWLVNAYNEPGAQLATGLKEQGFGPAPAPQNPGPFTFPGGRAAPSRELIRQSIKDIESSGGDYTAVGNRTGNGDRAYGAYQVMGNNIGPWTEQVLGRRMSPQEFLRNPAAQDQVFDAIFGEAAQKYGLAGAANVWFTGAPIPSGKKDANGTVDHTYVARFLSGLGQPVRDSMNPDTFNRPSAGGADMGDAWLPSNPMTPLSKDAPPEPAQ